ncbi:hypothetical protein TKV_c09860 [Thermoanaerobacter kivui]|uniref:Uncharacterized protein n=1 Tax=Thermoanaerobacter kivui TaxID=2325 RepID=A0A097AQS6_THEKI|nr:hypothetical protein [Thermoanaerobacter kivui]AIS52163.1 hypothetical protein TKV_c09860 [Thermoanaerobacter kivui]
MRLKRTKERKKEIRKRRLVIFAFLLYIVIMIAGLIMADSSFNEIAIGVKKVNIFGIYRQDQNVNFKFFGKETAIDIGKILDQLKVFSQNRF